MGLSVPLISLASRSDPLCAPDNEGSSKVAVSVQAAAKLRSVVFTAHYRGSGQSAPLVPVSLMVMLPWLDENLIVPVKDFRSWA